MLLFRSEEHLTEWLTQHGHERGATMSVETCWQLAKAWHSDRLDPAWRRPSVEQTRELFGSLGLTGGFWAMP